VYYIYDSLEKAFVNDSFQILSNNDVSNRVIFPNIEYARQYIEDIENNGEIEDSDLGRYIVVSIKDGVL
jgi:hypothetical protein